MNEFCGLLYLCSANVGNICVSAKTSGAKRAAAGPNQRAAPLFLILNKRLFLIVLFILKCYGDENDRIKDCEVLGRLFGRFCGVGISARSGIVRQLENDLVLFTATYRLD